MSIDEKADLGPAVRFALTPFSDQITVMQSEIATTFLAEAQDLLERVRNSVLIEMHTPGSSAGPAATAPLVVNLRTAAEEFGFPSLISDLSLLEDAVNATMPGMPLPADRAVALLGLLGRLTSALDELNIDSDELELGTTSTIDESLLSLELSIPDADINLGFPPPLSDPPLAAAHAAPPDEGEDEFEVDAEMLEVFAMEAEDLLRSIETNLETLEHEPANNEALWEIRRNAHTLKGAAGIVGLKKPSRLAHRVEDLLDRLAEKNAGSNSHILSLLRTASECLHRLTAGENSLELTEGIAQLYSGFDAVLSSLAVPVPVNPDTSLAADEKETIAANPVQTDAATIEERTAEITADPAPRPEEIGVDTEPQRTGPNRGRSIVRVSLERLDEMVRTMRELVTTRSVLEQRLSDVERQIEELHKSTRRLQSSCAKFEIDFEVSMLANGGLAPHNHTGVPKHPEAGFDTLEFDNYTEFHMTTRVLSETTRDIAAINGELESLSRHLDNAFDQQRRLIDDMQERLMRIRMVEFGALTTRLQRAVRVTCDDENKKASVVVENGHIEVDNLTLDGLIEPLMHLLKNAVVHGIEYPETRRLLGKPEMGEIRVRIDNDDTHIVLTVQDDGRGIAAPALIDKAVRSGHLPEHLARNLSNQDAIELIFLPGLTTAEKINLSAGRGVGMNIVKESIEAQKGSIAIESVPQKGTKFTLRVPLPLAVTNALLVNAGRQKYAIPAKCIGQICSLPKASVVDGGAGKEASLGNETLALHELEDLLGLGRSAELARQDINVLVIDTGANRVVIAAEEVLRTEEIVIRPLERPLDTIKGVSGAAILGTGELVAVLDIPSLLQDHRPPAAPPKMIMNEPDDVIVLIVDDSPSVRHMTSKVIKNAGWKTEIARDGMEAVEILRDAKKLPAIILSDIEMPRMDGYQMAVAIKENPKLRDIPLVFISSRSGEKHREQASAAGVTEYLTKPFADKELISTVKRLAGI